MRDTKRYVISVAAELVGMHTQTLRTYDKLGLVSPGRAEGGGRRYSENDIARLLRIQELSQEFGINLAGIKRIIELENQVSLLKEQMESMQTLIDERINSRTLGREIVLVPKTTAVTIWQPRKGGRN